MISDRAIGGFALDLDDLEARLVVELWLDGSPAAIARAHLHEPSLAAEGVGDACYGFAFALEASLVPGVREAEVRLANSGERLGAPVRIGVVTPAATVRGEARWGGGLRLTGWIVREGDDRPRLRALIDGEVVADGFADGWTQAGAGASARPERAFTLELPRALADGRVRQARVIDENARDLPGSPCAFVAFEDGLKSFLSSRAEFSSEHLLARLHDRLFPSSFPFAQFADWSRRFPPAAPKSQRRPRVAVALAGGGDPARSLESLSQQVGCDWIACEVAGEGDRTSISNAQLVRFLTTQAREADALVFAPAGAVLAPMALARLSEALDAFAGARIAYCDLVLDDEFGDPWPVALPAFDYERMLEQGYCAFVFAMRIADALEAAKAGVDDLFRMFNRTLDVVGPRAGEAVVHAPGFLARLAPIETDVEGARLARAVEAHLKARGSPAVVKPLAGSMLPSVRVLRERPKGRVSILIPTMGLLDLLRPCLEAIAATTSDVETEIIIVESGSLGADARAYLELPSLSDVRVAHASGPFRPPRLLGAGASIASGEFLLLARDDLEPLRPGWLAEMVGRIAEPDVGAVGALLIAPSGIIQHGAITLGPDFSAALAFEDRMDGDPGHADLLLAAHEVSAVSSVCLLTRRRLFQQFGGLDGVRFPSELSDVDFCLRLRPSGRRIVFTPHAKLRLRDSLARRDHSLSEDRVRRERDLLRNDWGEALVADPAYSPLLTLQAPYSGLAWPPRVCEPRLPVIGPRRRTPPGF